LGVAVACPGPAAHLKIKNRVQMKTASGTVEVEREKNIITNWAILSS
jgi:hypothetical protein